MFATYEDFPYYINWSFDFNEGYEGTTVRCSAPPSPSRVSNVFNSKYHYLNRLIDAENLEYDELEDIVIGSLNRGKPIILCERDPLWIVGNYVVDEYMKKNNYSSYYINRVGFPMYTDLRILTNGSGFKCESNPNVMTNHYVTITGMVKDNHTNRCWLKVQSWGKVYYIDLADFYSYESPGFDYSTAESTIIVFE